MARALPPAWLALFLCAYAALKAGFGVLICDDAYITLSHARSLAEGLGPVMSARNPVCATSTPLYTLLLAGESLLLRTANFETLAFATNLVFDAAGLFFVHRLAGGLGLSGPFRLAAVSAYGLSVSFLAVSAFGMETPLYAALALAGTYYRCYSEKPFPGLLTVCFLAPLVRPEGALLPAVLILSGLRRGEGWGRTLACAAAAALGLALFFGFYQLAYGRWLPHSVVAKRLELRVGALESLESWILNVFYKGPSFGGRAVVTVANLLAAAAAAWGFARRPGGPVPWALLAWPCAYILFFLATRSSYALFTWYYLPVLPFAILFLVAGLRRLVPLGKANGSAWAILFAFLVYVPVQTFLQGIPQKHRFAKQAREDRYLAAARILDAGSPPGSQVMVDEVGALGYFSRMKILDTHGLLSPEALPFLGGSADHWSRMDALQERFRPLWIMGMRPVSREGRLEEGEGAVLSGYRLEHALRLAPHPYLVEMWRREN